MQIRVWGVRAKRYGIKDCGFGSTGLEARGSGCTLQVVGAKGWLGVA